VYKRHHHDELVRAATAAQGDQKSITKALAALKRKTEEASDANSGAKAFFVYAGGGKVEK